MKTIRRFSLTGILGAVALAAFGLVSSIATADTVNAIFNSAGDVPVTASGYTATGNTVSFTLNFAPATGTDLMVVKNTRLDFINGTFDNFTNGQAVALSYGGITYRFVANYYGGDGNDLVLVWANNRAFAWGQNSFGQLGDNTSADRYMPVPVTTMGVLAGKTVLAMAAGWNQSLALCSDATLAAWGGNDYGQLGDGSTTRHLSPVAANIAGVLAGKTVVAIAGGSLHSAALCSDGTVAAWGDNYSGQLGDNQVSGFQSTLPVAVNTVSNLSALYGKTVVALAAGRYHCLALCSDGTVAAWGWNSNGQLGNNSTNDSLVPVAVNTASGVSALYGKTAIAVAAGYVHSLALCSDGTVVAWGLNSNGQLGDNSTNSSLVPVAVNTVPGVSALYNKPVVSLGAGVAHSLALCSDGTVVAWGGNNTCQIGDNTSTERHVPVAVNTTPGVSALDGKTVVAVMAGSYHNLARCSDGTVAAWGRNDHGQIGDNTVSMFPPYGRIVPVAVKTSPLAASQRFSRVFAGGIAYDSLALVAAPPASQVILTGAQRLSNGACQFSFTNTPGAFFGVLAATNPALPLSNWTSLTGLTEVSPGQFQFTDPQATNSPQRFYRVRSP